MAAEIMGVLMVIDRVNFDDKSTLRGKASEYEGTKRTSSKVKPSNCILSERNDMFYYFYDFLLMRKTTKK
jgi:hypothetical protein